MIVERFSIGLTRLRKKAAVRSIINYQLTMKSAYELAMERLEKQSPTAQLTEAQKAEIAEIDSTYKAKIAEQELFLKDKIAEAAAAGKAEDVAQLERQLAHEIRRFTEESEARKEKARASSGKR
ncbi:MAG: hypothetical protein QOE70_5615 [Chthoniobacter sp.]|jgi:hypothetical protein|nr:hypothetical protein [Chthoniobacter sp.]